MAQISSSIGLNVAKTIVCFVLIGSMLSNCQSTSKKEAEQVLLPAKTESEHAEKLYKKLGEKYGFWKDSKAILLTNRMIDRLTANESDLEVLKGTKPVFLNQKDVLFAPSIRGSVYFSKGVLAHTEYDNEFAFLVALTLAELKDREASRRLAELRGQTVAQSLITIPTMNPPRSIDPTEGGWFEPGGLFDFAPNSRLVHFREAIRIMYFGHFDPRGAISLMTRWYAEKENKRFIIIKKLLPTFEDQKLVIRDEIAKLSPLKDPIVKTAEFEALTTRIKKTSKN